MNKGLRTKLMAGVLCGVMTIGTSMVAMAQDVKATPTQTPITQAIGDYAVSITSINGITQETSFAPEMYINVAGNNFVNEHVDWRILTYDGWDWIASPRFISQTNTLAKLQLPTDAQLTTGHYLLAAYDPNGSMRAIKSFYIY